MSTPAPQSNNTHDPLWRPTQEQIEDTALHKFKARIENKTNKSFKDYHSLWQWSTNNIPEFWNEVWDFCGIIGEKGSHLLENENDMLTAQFFPEAQINYAENLLKKCDNDTALIFRTEEGNDTPLTYKQLHDRVSQWQQHFIAQGIVKGDRIAGYMPNMPETIIAMLAATSLGAIWSSASPDFGVQGVIDRFGQIKPKILIAIDSYFYNGKTIDCLGKLKEIIPQIPELQQTILIPFAGGDIKSANLPNTITESEFTNTDTPEPIQYTRVDFNHPLFIMFSSGTTGAPKCIVHGHGGTLIQHLKEQQLQSNIKEGDKFFYFTTCGWMMWNWLVSGLASGATLMLYDGSPFYPDGNILWDYAQDYNCTFFGTSAKYIDALKQADLKLADTHDLTALRAISSTGSPLVHESFDYVYSHIKKDVHLASICGGTDIISSFMLGNPISPVYRGELQGAGLGLAVNAYNESGSPIPEGAGSGELVCEKPFPCQPVMFWNDQDNAKYKAAYFERFDNIWVHGDWVERTPHHGYIVHGRSDATLNPGGIRIGTAEIYRQVEQIPAIQESICVGQDWEGDVRVILFIILKDGHTLDEALTKQIKTTIRTGASPRHTPAKIIPVKDIPRTKSGKITELAVRDIIMGRPIKNVEALANPEALELYKGLEELKS